MNKTKFLQTDSRWGGLGYPKKPWYIRNCGCGEVSIANIIIEMERYKHYTPATIQPYCKQFAAPNGDGTYFSGIPKMMEHYGLTEVKEHATMSTLWAELAKGDRVAIYLMGARKGGSKGVHWTSGGHFVCSVGYKYENGNHYVYVKDSYSNSSLRNGCISYEENMRNDVLRVWSGKLTGQLYGVTPIYDDAKLSVDGAGGINTVRHLQRYLGVTMTDGITIREDLQKYVPALTAYEYGKGSPTVKALQKWLGLSDPDGLWGSNTSRGLQKRLIAEGYLDKGQDDGIFGKVSMKALQRFLNDHMNEKAVYPETTIVDKELAACKTQADWMKNSKYEYEKNPTIEKSKKKGTCVTYVACVLQRIGILKSGQNLWHDEKGKVYGNNNKMTVIYPGNKTLSQLKSQLKAGDIIMDGSGVGSGSHIFILTGKWNGNRPVIWDNHSGQQNKGAYTYGRDRKVIAIVRLK